MASSLYEACDQLFESYPPATRAVNRSGTVCSMVLLLRNGDDASFFVLSRDRRERKRPLYSIFPWDNGNAVDIGDDSGIGVPDVVASAVTHGVPIPQDGSLFGWVCDEDISTLIPVYTDYTPESPEPSWAVMPRAGTPEAQWPPFTDEHLFGPWFWQHYKSGNVVSLGDLIAGHLETVFWADTESILGSGCCLVVHDITSPDGHTLRRGQYVYYKALRTGREVPSLDIILANISKTDLAPRFRS